MSPSSLAPEPALSAVLEAIRDRETGDRMQELALLGTLVSETATELNSMLRRVTESLDVALLRVKDRNYPELRNAIRDAREGVGQLAELASALRRPVTPKADGRTHDRQDDFVHAPQLLDVREVLDSTLRMLRLTLGRRARLERDYHEVPRVRAADSELRQILLNLLLNAIEGFDADDLERNRIRLVVRAGSCGEVIIEVSHTGRCIENDELEHVFDPLYTNKSGRFVPGLALTKRLLDHLGGTIVAQVSAHVTSLVVTLPSASSPAS